MLYKAFWNYISIVMRYVNHSEFGEIWDKSENVYGFRQKGSSSSYKYVYRYINISRQIDKINKFPVVRIWII